MKFLISKSFSERIKLLREDKGFTRKEMAEECHINERTISNIEDEKIKRIRESTIKIIADFFNIEYSLLTNLCTEQHEDIINPVGDIGGAPYGVRAASLSDLMWIENNNKLVYSGIDQITFSKMSEWYKVNNGGFNIIVDKNGRTCGNIDILPLKDDCLINFLEGKIIENNITGNDIVEESKYIKNLYVESFVSIGNYGNGNSLAAYHALMEAPLMLKRFKLDKVENIYAIAASEEGIQLVKHLGFTKIKDGYNRIDKHDIFSINCNNLIMNLLSISSGERSDKLKILLNEFRSKTL